MATSAHASNNRAKHPICGGHRARAAPAQSASARGHRGGTTAIHHIELMLFLPFFYFFVSIFATKRRGAVSSRCTRHRISYVCGGRPRRSMQRAFRSHEPAPGIAFLVSRLGEGGSTVHGIHAGAPGARHAHVQADRSLGGVVKGGEVCEEGVVDAADGLVERSELQLAPRGHLALGGKAGDAGLAAEASLAAVLARHVGDIGGRRRSRRAQHEARGVLRRGGRGAESRNAQRLTTDSASSRV
mmetsp:Transcript_41082/g.128802  ORF Transcript_41082/g.128802 Transcript_41082/m.128802 type:complete len:243 (-) Transcript_41082:436-1164(-)